MSRFTVVEVWNETEPPWDRDVPWILRILVRWGITMVALLAADLLLGDDISIDSWQSLLAAGGLFVVARAIARPILIFLTCPLQLITLGLFMLIVNGLVLSLVDWLCEEWGIRFVVHGFIAAVLGALVISLVSFALSRVLRRNPITPRRRH